jgi:hypothetical protein
MLHIVSCKDHAHHAGAGGGLSAGAWVGIAIGIAAAFAAVAAALFLFMRRRKQRQRRVAVLQRNSSNLMKGSGDLGVGMSKALDVIRQQQWDSSLGSMLRVRFGGLEGLEIGGLIGRGAFGRCVLPLLWFSRHFSAVLRPEACFT